MGRGSRRDLPTPSATLGQHERSRYSERRKFSTSCICERLSELNLRITSLASEPQLLLVDPEKRKRLLPQSEACAWIACSRSLVRPSCRKNSRWPTPHSGAVRN